MQILRKDCSIGLPALQTHTFLSYFASLILVWLYSKEGRGWASLRGQGGQVSPGCAKNDSSLPCFSSEYWEQLFASLQRSYYQSEGVTGLLLLYPAYVIHILEVRSLGEVVPLLKDMLGLHGIAPLVEHETL